MSPAKQENRPVSVESPPHLQHPGYPRNIGDILENGTDAERDALVAWLHEKLDFSAFRELAAKVIDEIEERP